MKKLLVALLLAVAILGTAAGAAAQSKTIEVKRGDTLGGLARRHGVSIAELTAANQIRRNSVIRIGQTLVIPGPGFKPPDREHVVVSGDTLGKLARRYDVSVPDLVKANGLRAKNHIRIGQKLIIPGSRPASRSTRKEASHQGPGGMQTLSVPGAMPAYYFEPEGPGRLGLRPVLMYMHGRGARPAGYCLRWAKVVRRFGWLVCPQGPVNRGLGGKKRGWGSNYMEGRRVAMATLNALRKKYGRRVQLYGNTIMGFSEGAFMAMNVGLMEPRAFNRWLILGADTDYWGPRQHAILDRHRHRIRRVYLITGKKDIVYDDTKKVRRWLRRAGVPVRVSTPEDLGHSVALESRPSMYKAALNWLNG